MKKGIFAVLTAAILAGCASGAEERIAVPREANVKHVCVDEQNYTSTETLKFIHNSLKKKGITSEAFRKTANCPTILAYSFKGKRDIISRAKMKLYQLEGGRKLIGEVAYYRRGDEKARAQQVGAEGQIDSMISELFKHY